MEQNDTMYGVVLIEAITYDVWLTAIIVLYSDNSPVANWPVMKNDQKT